MKEQQTAKFNAKASEFPTIFAANCDLDSINNKLEKYIANANKKRPPNFFLKTNQWESQHDLHKTSKLGSGREILLISKSFPNVPLSQIKAIYCELDETYDKTIEFLMERYKDLYQKPILNKKKVERKVIYKPKTIFRDNSKFKDADVDEILKQMTYKEIRAEIMSLASIKKVLQRTAARAKQAKLINQANSIESLGKEKFALYNLYSRASKHHVLQQGRMNNQLFSLDLHGLFLDEAKEVINEQIRFIEENITDLNDNAFKFDRTQKEGKWYVKYPLITGKGNNSKNGESILFKNLPSWLSSRAYYNQPNKSDGSIMLFIKI